MAGASILYNSLSANFKMDSLVVENNSTSNQSDTTSNKVNSDTTNSNTSSAEANSNTSSETTSNAENNSTSDKTTSNTADNTSNKANSAETKNLAPNFTVYDLEGKPVNLTDFFGKPIIVNFWASWCGPCKMEMPDFNEAYANYKDEIIFLMVNMTDGSRETVEVASSFIADNGYDFPVYYDTKYNASMTYSVTSLPTTYFINADGEAIAHARGAIDAEILQKGIDMIYFE